MHIEFNSKPFVTALTLIFCGLVACSSDSNDSNKGDGSTQNGNDGKGNDQNGNSQNGNGEDGCSGEITSCPLAKLNEKQRSDMCSLMLSAIDSPTGTKFECKDGPNEGLYLTVNSKEECTAAPPPPAACKITVGDLLACYKAAKNDACAAFEDSGKCGPLFASTDCRQ